MASEWLYQELGKQIGPISSAELRNLAQRGAITQDTFVRKAPDGAWVPAERVQGLFAVSNRTPPPIPVFAAVETKIADSSTAPNGSLPDDFRFLSDSRASWSRELCWP